jgi:hypothetical protein
MAVVKNTNSDYIITSKDGTGNVTINANTQIFGYLGASGDFMTVAYLNNGTYTNVGVIAQTALDSWAGLRFNSTANRWEVSPVVEADGTPVSPYSPIGGGADGTPGGPNLSLQFNNDGEFGGDANLLYDGSNNSLLLDGYQYFVEQSSVPSSVPNNVALYSNIASSGGTGLYVSGSTSGELISANRALLYSIIF